MEILNINEKTDKLYYVGGIIRDELLDIPNLDVDMVYVGDAISFAKENNFDILQTNEPFGTVRVKFNNNEIDIASTRTETYPKRGHLPEIEKSGVSLQKDVKRRDFTINSLYKSVNTGEIVDLTNGLEDLKNKKIKVLHDESFIDDPTRIIRALKFRVRFGFELDSHTKQLQDEYLNNINYDMCYKRVKKELVDTFGSDIDFERKIKAFEIFIDEGIFKLVTKDGNGLEEKQRTKKKQEDNNILYSQFKHSPNSWLVFVGQLNDLSRLPLTKQEQKIIDDVEILKKEIPFKNDFAIYKAFEKCELETILLYGIKIDEKIATHYLKDLKNIKISITGNDLINLGFNPSKKFAEIFDYVLNKKLKSPNMTKSDEIEVVKNMNL